MKTYRALKPFPHGNSYVASGATVNLTGKQVTFLVGGGYVVEADCVPDAPALADPAPSTDANATKKGAK